MGEIIEFLASFPPIQCAMKRSGGGDGMRIQLDIPETELGNAVLLLACPGKRLRVRIEVLGDDDGGSGITGRRTRKKRISAGSPGLQ